MFGAFSKECLCISEEQHFLVTVFSFMYYKTRLSSSFLLAASSCVTGERQRIEQTIFPGV